MFSVSLIWREVTWKEAKLFFDEIKKAVPNFEPESLTSDEALAFYNGYKASFPSNATELFFCRFHYSRSVRQENALR